MNFKDFFKPTWKKLTWFFLVFLVAQLYSEIIMFYVPTNLIQGFISFIFNPGVPFLKNLIGLDNQLVEPIGRTISIVWNYFLATLLAREISKDTE